VNVQNYGFSFRIKILNYKRAVLILNP